MIQLSVTVECDHDDGNDFCESQFTSEPPAGRLSPEQAEREAGAAINRQVAGRGWVMVVEGGRTSYLCPLHRPERS